MPSVCQCSLFYRCIMGVETLQHAVVIWNFQVTGRRTEEAEMREMMRPWCFQASFLKELQEKSWIASWLSLQDGADVLLSFFDFTVKGMWLCWAWAVISTLLQISCLFSFFFFGKSRQYFMNHLFASFAVKQLPRLTYLILMLTSYKQYMYQPIYGSAS